MGTAQAVPATEIQARLQANSTKYVYLEHGDLRAQANTQNSDVERDWQILAQESACTVADCPPEDASNHWRVKQAVSESDLVAIGTVISNTSALTAHNGFVFTDSELVLDEVLRAKTRVGVGSEITVTGSGGSVTMDGHRITATLNTIVGLQVQHRYLLFLKYLPDSRSYQATAIVGYDVTTSPIQPLRTNVAPPGKEYFQNLGSFLDAMRSSTHHAIKEEKQ